MWSGMVWLHNMSGEGYMDGKRKKVIHLNSDPSIFYFIPSYIHPHLRRHSLMR
jgi:hypothetical protein